MAPILSNGLKSAILVAAVLAVALASYYGTKSSTLGSEQKETSSTKFTPVASEFGYATPKSGFSEQEFLKKTSPTPKFNPEFVRRTPLSVGDATVIPTPTSVFTLSGPIVKTPSNVPTLNAELDALREVAEGSRNNSDMRISGARGSSSGRRNTPAAATSTPQATPTPTSTVFARVGGQARGIAMLSLMQPEARLAVEAQIKTLLDAQIQEIYLGVLTDGTFSVDYEYLGSVIRRLNTGGRSVWLALYLSNGSTMRKFDSTNNDAGFNTIDPITFRGLIQFDSAIRSQFQSMVIEARKAFELNRRLGSKNRNIAIVMLEDNLDRESYISMRDLAKQILGPRVVMLRNPCPACFEGNDIDPLEDALEMHREIDFAALRPGDGFTLDGIGYTFANEFSAVAFNIDQVRELTDRALANRLAYFGLWRNQRQGLGDAAVHPKDRTYEVTTDEQRQIEIELLRHGLKEIATPAP